jgi:tetratricopeptide (TPR) repeat protein
MSPRTPRQFRLTALLVFGVAFAVRLLHLRAIASAPFFTLLLGDAKSYDAWARGIAAGDWLGRDVFYQAPLYPYFLGVLYRIAGRDLMVVRVVQAAIGSLSCVLLASASRRLFRERAGVAAGLLLALWAPAIFFDSLLQKSVLDVFLVSLIVWLVVQIGNAEPAEHAEHKRDSLRALRVLRSHANSWWLALGLAAGALALTRENALVVLIVLLAWALLSSGRREGVALDWRRAGWFVAGAALVLMPVAARNYAVGGGFYLTTSQFGPNFYIGNNPAGDGTYASLRYGRGAPEFERQDATDIAERAIGRRLSPAEVSGYWTDRALDFVTGQPVAWLRLLGRKFALLWNATEMVDTESQESYAEWSWPLRVLGPVTHFGVLVPLALAGILLRWPPRGAARVLLAIAAAYAASVLVFYVFGRYRYPLVPLLIVFAAAALDYGVGHVSDTCPTPGSRKFQDFDVFRAKRATLTGLILLAAVFANWRIVPHDWMRAVSETNLAVALQGEGRFDDALDRYQRALALRPEYAPALNNMATAYRAAGRLDEAVTTYRRALAAQPDFPDAQYNLANALLQQGSADEAIGRFESALRSMPDSADVHNNLGTALADKGRAADAIREFQAALALDPASAIAHRNLGSLLASTGDRAGAVDHLRRAVQADPADAGAHYDLGGVLLEAGAFDEAIAELRAAVDRRPDWPEAHNNLGIALGSAGRLPDAIVQFREALRLRPDFPDARRNLEMASAARGRVRPSS